MNVVDFSFCSLVSCMRMMYGVVGRVCVSSWMLGRLELKHHVFHVIIFRVVVWWLRVFVFVGGVGLVFGSCVGGGILLLVECI